MLTAFIRAFRTPDLRKKLLFTLGIIALFRFGSSLPAPGINEANVSTCSNVAANSGLAGTLQIVDLLSGNALKYMSVFALGIMPYITASIILQLLTVVIPRLETLKNEGQAGQAKITQYTRYLTIGLAILQSTGYIELARSGTLFPGCTVSGHPGRVGLPHRDDGHHHGGRHRGDHVDGRAHHRPRHRQRHVGHDLHAGHRGHPGRAADHLPDQEGVHRAALADRGLRGRRVRGLHGAGAAAHPGAVRQADGGPPDVRRHVHLHPDEGEPGRRHPGHLRLKPAVHPAARDLAVRQPDATRRAGSPGCSATWRSAAAPRSRTCGCTWPRSSC